MDNKPWIEIYKPKKLSDLYLHSTINYFLEDSIKKKDVENSIFFGPSGIGKTATVLCIAREIYKENFNECVLIINGSDDRGIKIVQDNITTFCKKKTKLKKSKYKLVLLDEADNMTINTQQLINTLLETYKNNTRFIFTCNDSSKIIEALQSRCRINRFPILTEKQVIKCLTKICKKRDIEYTNNSLIAINSIYQGDMRSSINALQLVYTVCKKITENNVFSTVNKPNPDEMKDLLITSYNGELTNSVKKLCKIKDQGYSSSDIILSMIYTIRKYIHNEIKEIDKIYMLKEISQTFMVISKGMSSELQLVSCICSLVSMKNH